MDEVDIADDADHDMVVRLARLHMEPDRAGKQADLHALLADADERDLVNAAIFGRLCLALVQLKADDLPAGAANFAWCEQRWTERAPELGFITVDLLLALYGVLIYHAREQPSIPFRQINDFVDAFTRRHRQYGRSMRQPYLQAFLAAFAREDVDEAERWFRRWQAEPDADDVEPRHSIAMVWLARTHDWPAVVAQYQRGLAAADGHEWTLEYLHAGVLEALVHLGRGEEAAQVQQLAHAAIARDDPGLESIGYQLNYCRLTEQHERGLALLAESIPWLADNRAPGLRVDYVQHAVALMHQLQRRGLGAERVHDSITVDGLARELRAEAVRYAETVDQVNRTTVGTERLQRFWAEHGVG